MIKKFFFACTLLCSSFATNAFTPAQQTILRTAVQADVAMLACVQANDDPCVADWFNLNSTFIVWRTSVTQSEYQNVTSSSGTNFDWASAGGFIARSQAERDAWRTLFAQGVVDPSKTNVRSAFDDIFSGTGTGAVNNRTHLAATSKRVATNGERALSTGIGTTISPGFTTWEGVVTVLDAGCILRGCP